MTTTENDTRIPVIFILSPGHSGSTLLDLLISGHNDIVTGGEFRTWDKQLNQPCTCGAETVWRCDFWQAVNDELKSYGYDIVDIEQHGRDTDDFADFNDKLFRAMQYHSGASVILDSSKRPKRLRALLQHPDKFNVHIILLTREPLGVMASNMRKGRALWPISLSINRGHLKQLLYAHKASSFVMYEDFVKTPDNELQRLMHSVGLDYEPGQKNPADKTFHNLGGNRLRFEGLDQLEIDNSWKTRLTLSEKIMAVILTIPGRLFNRLGALVCKLACWSYQRKT
jgi:hypothetical protein